MAISGSTDDDRWIARAELFSGRPDPCWPLESHAVAALDRLWAQMKPLTRPRPRPPSLGYRGCHVALRGLEYFAFGGAVTFTAGAEVETRIDADRTYERRVLASAPAGVIPDELARNPP